jgi:hypothetical protein
MPDGSGLDIYSARLLARAHNGEIQLLVGNESHKTKTQVPLSQVAQCFDAGTILQGSCVISIFVGIDK